MNISSYRFACGLFALALTAFAPAAVAGPQAPASADAAPNTAVPMTQEDVAAFLDGIMDQRLKRDDIAGAVVAIVKDGQVLFEKGYGYSDMASKTPVTVDRTLFGIGSISKTFTATAVMQLVERGKLDLDVDVQRYLDFKLRRSFPEPITLRRLLTHTAGLEEGGKDANDPPGETSKLGPFLKGHQPAQIFHPGSRIAYSNYGVSLAGYIVERVSGEPFARYVAEHIYRPLDMRYTTFEAPLPANLAPLASQEYRLASEPPRPIEYVARRPAGGMYSTADDMTHFMLAHLQNGQYGGNRILQDATVREMHTIQWRARPDAPGIAIVFYQYVGNGRFVLAHGGDLADQHSYLWLIPSERVGVFIAFNSSGTDWKRVRGDIWQALLDRYFPPNVPPPKPSLTAASDARAVTGYYLTTRRPQTSFLSIAAFLTPIAVMANSDNSISLAGVTNYDGTLRKFWPTGNLLFRDRHGHVLAFVRNQAGSPHLMIVDGVAEYERQGGLLNGHAQGLLFLATAGILILSTIWWPLRALICWRFGRPEREEFTATARRRRLIVRWVTLAAVVELALGAYYLEALANLDLSILSGHNDPYIRMFQLIALAVVAGSVFAGWSAIAALKERQGSLAHRLGLAAVSLSLLTLSVLIVAYDVLSTSLNY